MLKLGLNPKYSEVRNVLSTTDDDYDHKYDLHLLDILHLGGTIVSAVLSSRAG